MFAVYLFGLFHYIRAWLTLRRLYGTDFLKVIFVKNFESKTLYDQDEDQSDPIDIGVTYTLLEEQDRQASSISSRNYRKNMTDIAKRLGRSYLDCNYFLRLNKQLYLVVLLLQVLGSMTFNGVFDIPALVMLLLLFSLYAFRKSHVRGYGLYVLFLVFYIHLAAFANLMFQALTEIDFVLTWMSKHQDSTIV
jgi:hypothetical protein